jgi:NitT/TauT family transport system substrate-binding protein
MKACSMKNLSSALFATAVLALGTMISVPSFAADKIRVVFPAPPTTLTLPYLVAKKKGYFGDLNLEEIYVSGDANAVRALASGNAEYMICGVATTLLTVEKGGKFKIVSSDQPLLDFNFIMQPSAGGRVEDMKGKVFVSTGPGNVTDVLGRAMLKLHKVDPKDVRFITVTGGHSGMYQTVVSGRGDAALVNTLTALQGQRAGKVKIAALAAKEAPAFGYVNNVVRDESITDPKLAPAIQTLVAGGIRASRFIMQNPDEAAAILHEKMPDLDLNYLKEVVRSLNDQKVWGIDGGISKKASLATVKAYHGAGLISSDIPLEKLYDTRFVDAAIAKIEK